MEVTELLSRRNSRIDFVVYATRLSLKSTLSKVVPQ